MSLHSDWQGYPDSQANPDLGYVKTFLTGRFVGFAVRAGIGRCITLSNDDYTEWYSGCRLQLFHHVNAAGARRMARHLTEPAPAMALVEGGCLEINCQQLLPEPLA